MDPADVNTGWDEAAPRSLVHRSGVFVGLLLAVAGVAWLVAAPMVVQPPAEPAELAVETAFPQPEVIDRVSFLGNSMLIDDVSPSGSGVYVAVQWAGGSMAVPYEPGGPPDLAVFYQCHGEPVRVSSTDVDVPAVLLIAGAGVHSRLMGCQPAVPDVRLDSMGLSMWSLPMLVRLDSTGWAADLSTGRNGELDIVLQGSGTEPWVFTLLPAFGIASRPPVGSDPVDLAGGQALLSHDDYYLNCDRGSMVVVTEDAAALEAHLNTIGCVPFAPVRPRDPMDELLTATQLLADAVTAGGLRMVDLESHRPVVRFTLDGPVGNVRMLAMSAVTVARAGDIVIQLPDGAVLRRRDGGTVAECNAVLLAIDPEYEPLAISTLQAMARAAGCSLRTPGALTP